MSTRIGAAPRSGVSSESLTEAEVSATPEYALERPSRGREDRNDASDPDRGPACLGDR